MPTAAGLKCRTLERNTARYGPTPVCKSARKKLKASSATMLRRDGFGSLIRPGALVPAW